MAFDMKGFAARLSALRIERGFTQAELAQRAGLSTHYVGNLEQSIRHPSMKALLALCAALGTTPDHLFQDSISEDMEQGRCAIVPDDYALRDVDAALQNVLKDWLEPDMPGDELFDECPSAWLSLDTLLEDTADS